MMLAQALSVAKLNFPNHLGILTILVNEALIGFSCVFHLTAKSPVKKMPSFSVKVVLLVDTLVKPLISSVGALTVSSSVENP